MKKILTDIDLNGNKLKNATLDGAAAGKIVVFDANGKMTAGDAGSNVTVDSANSRILIADGADSYFVNVTKLTKPATPTIAAAQQSKSAVTGSVEITIGNIESGATAYYKIGDAAYAQATNGKFSIATGFTNEADNSVLTKSVKVKAVKNGVESDESSAYTITITPKVAKPTLTTSNADQYEATATVTISKSATTGATTEYSTDGGSTWTTLAENSKTITVSENKAAGAYKARATKSNYTASDTAQSSAITLNLPKIFYGVTNDTLTAAVVSGLTALKEGKSNKSLSYTATAQHGVLAYPKTYGSLTHILDPNGYENISGWTQSEINIGSTDYYVYRSDDALTCNNFIYDFQF